MQRKPNQQALEADGSEQSDQDASTDSDISEPRLLEIEKICVGELREKVVQTLESSHLRSAKKQVGEEIAARSDLLRYTHRIRIDASSTEELREVQEDVGIDEKTIRELQAEAGLQRLYRSRRKEFIKQLLGKRINTRAAALVDEEQVRHEAKEEIAHLFEGTGDVVGFAWTLMDRGSFAGCRETEDPDMIAAIQHATTDLSETSLSKHAVDIVVLEGGADVTVESSFGTRSFTLSRGAYKIRARSVRALAQEFGLIKPEKRAARCSSSDKTALDIEVDETENTARVVELRSGDGGYSSRYTEGWTLYRDFDPDREMVLITVGQKSFYRGSFRGEQERTWLVGRDEGQTWAHQVYNTHTTIDEALDFLKPAEVKQFEAEGRQIIRQGDVYFVEMIRRSNFEVLEDTRHSLVQKGDDTVMVSHPEHENLELTGEWKAIVNNDGSHP